MSESNATYKIFADFYDLYIGGFDADFEFYKSYCHKTDKILEVGCGTGRILNVLLQKGCKVIGVDISQEMLDKAGGKYSSSITSGNLTLINHNFITHKFAEQFDKILLTFYTFNYVLEEPVQFIKNIYDSLAKNGLLFIDLFYPNSLFDKSISGKWICKEYEINGCPIEIRDCRTIDNDIEYREQIFIIEGVETKIDTKRKYYSPSSLREILTSAGFQDIVFSYNYDYDKFEKIIDEDKLTSNYIVKVKK